MSTVTWKDYEKYKKDSLEEKIEEAIWLKNSLLERGFKEKDMAFFMTMDIQREFASFDSKIVHFKIKPSEEFMGCPLHLIQGKNNMYIGLKIIQK